MVWNNQCGMINAGLQIRIRVFWTDPDFKLRSNPSIRSEHHYFKSSKIELFLHFILINTHWISCDIYVLFILYVVYFFHRNITTELMQYWYPDMGCFSGG